MTKAHTCTAAADTHTHQHTLPHITWHPRAIACMSKSDFLVFPHIMLGAFAMLQHHRWTRRLRHDAGETLTATVVGDCVAIGKESCLMYSDFLWRTQTTQRRPGTRILVLGAHTQIVEQHTHFQAHHVHVLSCTTHQSCFQHYLLRLPCSQNCCEEVVGSLQPGWKQAKPWCAAKCSILLSCHTCSVSSSVSHTYTDGTVTLATLPSTSPLPPRS